MLAPTACQLTVSCSISLPYWGSCHHSLAVLCTIGHLWVFSLTAWSRLIHTGFHVSHATRDMTFFLDIFITTGLSPSMVQDSAASSYYLKNFKTIYYLKNFKTISCFFVFPLPLFTGLGLSRFARRYYGNRFCFLFLQLLRCFNSLGLLFPSYELIGSSCGCPIRESSDLSLLPTPWSVSPVSAPFIVYRCLGIHRKP